MKKLTFLLMAVLPYITVAQQIRAVFINVPNGGDDGQEYFEISGTSGASLSGLYFVSIEGDNTGAGLVDLVMDLSAYSLGSNGLLLWRDASSVIMPAPDAATTLVVGDFNPDIENGSNTFLLVSATTAPIVNTDIDSNNDGTANTSGLPWTTVLSAVSVVENDGANNYVYADDFGGTVIGPFAAYNPDGVFFNNGVWEAGDILGTNPGGPYTIDPARNNVSGTYNATLTPGNTLNPLPILLKHLRASLEEGACKILWATAHEIRNAYFSIEHSTDGIHFTQIGKVSGAGNSDTPREYTFTDLHPAKGLNFYRLRQVDFDGNFAYSPLVSVSLDQSGELRLSPMPTAENLRVQLDEVTTEVLVWQVFDNTGRQVRFGKEVAEIQVFDLNVNDLAEGFYTLRVVSGQKAMTKRFQKKLAF